ncbi:uncharacterized protein LOC129960312 isoform X1 [Argiope bruennichi]|uniref:uncharacterized protein LOC129960312 isoform X1 n=1 Tax=Argiope bruennichi TaxID=94029 RepID=UPI0024948518|nr:uncharacterized protein LOC129960312 isoform X1 [Argiope bruennichi]
METASDDCPTGILIDIDLQTEVLSYTRNENKKSQVVKNKKEKNIVADTGSSHPWASYCLMDQSPLKPPPILQRNICFTPKSNWKTPSPKSMKIISREASRIVDQLYSSPINCSEAMICDEVFPAVKSLDDACFDEDHIKPRNLFATNVTFTHENVDRSNPDSFNLAECTVSDISSSKSVGVLDEKLSAVVLQSDRKSPIEHDSISEKIIASVVPENAPSQESYDKFCVNDKNKVKFVTCAVNSSSVNPEYANVSSDKLLAPESEVTIHKKMPVVTKGFGFKTSLKTYAEENVLQANGTRQPKYGGKFSKTEKSCSSSEDGTKETKVRKNQILKDESILTQSSKKNITAKYQGLEKKKDKENQNLEDHFSENMVRKAETFLQKSNIVRSQSLFCKQDRLCKTEKLLETPTVVSSVRRFNSFHAGSSRNAIPTAEKKIPTTCSSSRVLKPKMSLNQVSSNGIEYSTPLQFGKYSQNFKNTDLSATNPMRRKSLAFNSNVSLIVSNKKNSQNDQHSITKKPAETSSNRLGFGKKLNVPSSHPKLKNDSLSRKLFP